MNKSFITFNDIKKFKNSIRIGQTVQIINSDEMWGRIKKKYKAVICKKSTHGFCVQYVDSGIKEFFSYVQMMMGEGPWLV